MKFKEAPLGEPATASPWGILVDSLPDDMKDVARLAVLNFAEYARTLLAGMPLIMTSGDGNATLLTLGPDTTVSWPGNTDAGPLPTAGAIQINPAGRTARTDVPAPVPEPVSPNELTLP